ncbi:MAG TPA: arginine deiminase family protein [Bryobacteraceae bacterium]|nr:arginine deiminase family protein [Bryobacteraceae bacterium]
MLMAITRQVSPAIGQCEVTFVERSAIDAAKAVRQHGSYEKCLRDLGAEVVSMPADPRYPDGVFVEDPAIVLDEIAVMCRMGAESRRGEVESLAETVGRYRELRWIREPATIEGGDVVRMGKRLFVGLSGRTNREGCAQLAEAVALYGYSVVPVEVRGCLHLKSACCAIGDGVVLLNREWIDARPLEELWMIDVAEPWGADVLRIGETVLMPDGFPKTRDRLERAGFRTRRIDVSELQKAEAGVTCMSLVFQA